MVLTQGGLSQPIKRERRPTLSLAAVSGRRNRNALLGGVEQFLDSETRRDLQRWTDCLLGDLARFDMRRRNSGLFGRALGRDEADRLLKAGVAALSEGGVL